MRCVEHAKLSLHPQQNLIWGDNGSGKTSLLEAAFLLGRGRSFRTRQSERLIRHGETQLVVAGRVIESQVEQTLGVQVSKGAGTVAKIEGDLVRTLAELSQVFPVQIIDPSVHALLEEGGYRRRRWLDWAVFHVEPWFVDTWLRYSRALKQRNMALRQQPSTASAWDGELARLGEAVAVARSWVLERLEPHWHATVADLAGLTLELQYARGWPQTTSLEDALEASRPRDTARQVTHPGPHRADILIRLGGRAARDVLSRGQQKLVSVALVMAQLQYLQSEAQIRPTLLLDDPAAELDELALRRFTRRLAALDCQLILAALHADSPHFGAPNRVFHVEQGRVRPV